MREGYANKGAAKDAQTLTLSWAERLRDGLRLNVCAFFATFLRAFITRLCATAAIFPGHKDRKAVDKREAPPKRNRRSMLSPFVSYGRLKRRRQDCRGKGASDIKRRRGAALYFIRSPADQSLCPAHGPSFISSLSLGQLLGR